MLEKENVILQQRMFLDEFKENNLQVDTIQIIVGLQAAGDKLTDLAKKKGNKEDRDSAIDCLNAVLSAITYISLMNTTAECLNKWKGGKGCV